MNINISIIIIWLIVGALAGSMIGMFTTSAKKGSGRWMNFCIGLVGAFLGGVIFRFFRIDLGLGRISVSLEDVVAALVGSIIFILFLRFINR
jgi:uncharacterized membrane protein YeaQ/YmgE (transglycosylase-associated protein family)